MVYTILKIEQWNHQNYLYSIYLLTYGRDHLLALQIEKNKSVHTPIEEPPLKIWIEDTFLFSKEGLVLGIIRFEDPAKFHQRENSRPLFYWCAYGLE